MRGLWCALLLAVTACARTPPAAGPPGEPPPPVVQPPTPDPAVRIGLLVSEHGPAYLRSYATAVREGVRVAIAQHEREGGRRVEVVIREDSGKATRAAALVRELEQANVVGIVGPLLDVSLNAAARARSSNDLVLVGPIATAPSTLENVYALNVEDTTNAVALGAYAAANRMRTGVIHVRSADATAEARAFARAVTAGGGAPPVVIPFDSGTTTFATQIRRLRDARVQALFIAAPLRDIRQLLPQLPFYGLEDVQLLGGELWMSEQLRRSVPDAQLEGVIIATVLPRSSSAVGWSDFEQQYGETFKRSPASPIPALGYDAARILLGSLPRGRASAADVAREVRRLGSTRGATGLFRLDDGAAVRRAFLLRIRNGTLEPVITGGT